MPRKMSFAKRLRCFGQQVRVCSQEYVRTSLFRRDTPLATSTLPTVEKTVVYASCDAGCILTAWVKNGRVVKVTATDIPLLRDNICMKGIYAPKVFAHPDRVLYPLRRVGERGSGDWE